jgi:hypothetical protein
MASSAVVVGSANRLAAGRGGRSPAPRAGGRRASRFGRG